MGVMKFRRGEVKRKRVVPTIIRNCSNFDHEYGGRHYERIWYMEICADVHIALEDLSLKIRFLHKYNFSKLFFKGRNDITATQSFTAKYNLHHHNIRIHRVNMFYRNLNDRPHLQQINTIFVMRINDMINVHTMLQQFDCNGNRIYRRI